MVGTTVLGAVGAAVAGTETTCEGTRRVGLTSVGWMEICGMVTVVGSTLTVEETVVPEMTVGAQGTVWVTVATMVVVATDFGGVRVIRSGTLPITQPGFWGTTGAQRPAR